MQDHKINNLPYRENVAAFILNTEGRILTCKRSDKFPDWQLPQGGIDEGETPYQAVKRELYEEIGLEEAELISQIDAPVSYEWPRELYTRGYRGQNQYFFLFRAPENWIPKLDIHEHLEFEITSWDTASEFKRKINKTFRAPSYLKALETFMKINPDTFKE